VPKYNPPPNWPAPPPGWTPPDGWKAPNEWGPPPKGWKLWVPAGDERSWFARNKRLSVILGVLAALLLFTVASGRDDPVPNATGTPSSAASTATPTSKPSPSPQPSPSLVSVPDVVGLGLVKAKQELHDAGLELGKLDRRPSSKKKGTVLKQGVAEGTEVKPDSSVPLVVGAPLPSVPTVVGPEASAIRQLKNAGFRVEKRTETRTTGRDGVVLSQSPAGGTRAKPNSVVGIVILNVQPAPDKPEADNCTPGYSPCLPPASDYDCAGGSGNGPKYTGPVRVTGSDPYDLDRDGDGTGCDE